MSMKTFHEYGIDDIWGLSGMHRRTTCPKCSPSRRKTKDKCLSVNIEEGVWFCHHCGWSGALQKRRTNYKRPLYNPLNLPEQALEFFKARKISRDVLKVNNIGWEKGLISFPYVKDGGVVNIKKRKVEKGFSQSAGGEPCLYRFDAISMLKGLLICSEGEMDALAIQTAGFPRVTSIPNGAINPGVKNFETKFDFLISAEKIIDTCDKVILAMDDDLPGRAMRTELTRRIGIEKCWFVEYPEGCKDANDVLMLDDGKEILARCIENAEPCPVPGLHTVMSFGKRSEDRMFDNPPAKIKTGWRLFDLHYSPEPGMFTIITGIPGSGKSTWLDNLILNMNQRNGWRFAVFSSENWPIDRHINLLAEKYYKKNKKDITLEELRLAHKEFNEFLFFIYLRNEGMSLDSILEKARAAVYRHGIRGLIIDPWNEIEHAYQGMSEAQYLAQALSKIREFCATNQVHVWLVAHPRLLQKNKDGGYQPPGMYEISGGAQWRNKADFGLCVHRNHKEGGMSNITDIHIQKVRFADNGKVGRVSFTMRQPGVFYEIEQQEPERW